MTTLDTIIAIAEIILFISLTILAVYLISSFKKITASVQKIESDVSGIERKLEPLIENTNKVVIDAGEITSDLKVQLIKVYSTIDALKEKGDEILSFTSKVQGQIGKPVNESINFISAVGNGVKTFFSHLKRKDNGVM